MIEPPAQPQVSSRGMPRAPDLPPCRPSPPAAASGPTWPHLRNHEIYPWQQRPQRREKEVEGEGIYDRAGCGGGSDEDLIEKQETLEMGGRTLAHA